MTKRAHMEGEIKAGNWGYRKWVIVTRRIFKWSEYLKMEKQEDQMKLENEIYKWNSTNQGNNSIETTIKETEETIWTKCDALKRASKNVTGKLE